MSHRHHQRAAKVVAEFKNVIGDPVCALISDAHFEDLVLLVRDAITDEVLSATERVENILKDIRSETDLHELGI